MRTITILLILALLALTGTALAIGSPADWTQPRLERISDTVQQATGWDCRPLIVDNTGLFAAAVVCEK